MTRVCIVGSEDVDLRFELLSRETSREALETYDVAQPWVNTVAIETISLGAAVSLLNDLNWYLVRFADAAMILEPSVSTEEWLSRPLATAVRDSELDPEGTGELVKIYGVEFEGGGTTGQLVEPLFAQRVGGEVPEYDLRDVEETVVVRVTEGEFGG